MNVVPAHYTWSDFYDQVIGLTHYSFRARAIGRRFRATRERIPRWMNVMRAVSSEGFGRLRYYRALRRRLDTDRSLRRFYERETNEVPAFFRERVRRDLGPLWQWLPDRALSHDPNAYLRTPDAWPDRTRVAPEVVSLTA